MNFLYSLWKWCVYSIKLFSLKRISDKLYKKYVDELHMLHTIKFKSVKDYETFRNDFVSKLYNPKYNVDLSNLIELIKNVYEINSGIKQQNIKTFFKNNLIKKCRKILWPFRKNYLDM